MSAVEILLSKSSRDLVAHPELKLEQLRHETLVNGDGMSEHRIYVWLIFLNATPINTDEYLALVGLGASAAYQKIRNDTFRTFPNDPLFRRRVTENSLTRVLNAMAWKLIDSKEGKTKGWRSPEAGSITGAAGSPDNSFISNGSLSSSAHPAAAAAAALESDQQIGYKQGMNVLAGVFLYAARSEAQAFVAFERLITKECPGYVRATMDGVHKGLELVDEVLATCDPKLATHLLDRGLTAKIYGFASVLTMCACTAPLPEVLKLWDFLFAYGLHLNIVCIVAQLVLIRDRLLASDSPNSLLRTLPNLQTEKIKALAISFVPKIPDDLYGRIVDHAK